jgi:uncharacterized RDD family membrane protein YckC
MKKFLDYSCIVITCVITPAVLPVFILAYYHLTGAGALAIGFLIYLILLASSIGIYYLNKSKA